MTKKRDPAHVVVMTVTWGWYALKLTALVCVVWSIGSKMKF